MASETRPYAELGDYVTAGELFCREKLSGPGVAALFVNGDPNAVITGVAGQLAIDTLTGNVWQNTTSAMVWVAFGGGGGGAPVLTVVGEWSGPIDDMAQAAVPGSLLYVQNNLPDVDVITVTLPPVAGLAGQVFALVVVPGGTGVGGIVVAPSGGDTVDGDVSLSLENNILQAWLFVCDGSSDWSVIARGRYHDLNITGRLTSTRMTVALAGVQALSIGTAGVLVGGAQGRPLIVSGGIQDISYVAPAALVASVNDYEPLGFRSTTNLAASGVCVMYQDATGPVSITGFWPASARFTFVNTSAFVITLVHDSGLSTGVYRLRCPGLVDLAVPAGGAVTLLYDLLVGRWQVVGGF